MRLPIFLKVRSKFLKNKLSKDQKTKENLRNKLDTLLNKKQITWQL